MIAVHHRVSVQTHARFAMRTFGRPGIYGRLTREVLNSLSLAHSDDFRRDSDLFLECMRDPEAQRRMRVAMNRGFQTHAGEWT